jgi:signal transduction histidine kinase
MDIENTNLLNEVNNVIKNCNIIIEENNIMIENNINEKIFVKADILSLGELLNNLITNSIKYTTEPNGKITINAKEEKDIVTVSIKDTGIGINESELDHIFDEFYKIDVSRHDLDSSGLGLSICRRIVEIHGGKIWAESLGESQGTTFNFTLKSGKKEK